MSGERTVGLSLTTETRGKVFIQWEIAAEDVEVLTAELTSRFGDPLLEMAFTDAGWLDDMTRQMRRAPGVFMVGRDGADQ